MNREFRVAEIFGPTIQGEGAMLGVPCIFIRFGGCDFRCAPCDSPHAVLPDLVAKLPKMNEFAISHKVAELAGRRGNMWVVYSGGNPGLLGLSTLTRLLRNQMKFKVQCETQGTTYRQWYHELDHLCFSPKGPGMASKEGHTSDLRLLDRILGKIWVDDHRPTREWISLKVVVFGEEDLEFAREVKDRFAGVPLFLSVGNHEPGPTVGNGGVGVAGQADIPGLLDRLRWLSEAVANDPDLYNVRVTPQMHVLTWGNERGR